LNLAPDIDQAHPKPNDTQQEKGLHYPDYRPGAAKDVNAAQHHSSDDDQFKAKSQVSSDAAKPSRQNNTPQSRHQAGQREEEDLDAVNTHPGVATGLLVLPDSIHVPT